MKYTSAQLATKKAEILESLGLSRPPVNLSTEQVAIILDTSINTLSVWRSTGRYNLSYVKVSRRVAYPLSNVAKFLLKREVKHTGDA